MPQKVKNAPAERHEALDVIRPQPYGAVRIEGGLVKHFSFEKILAAARAGVRRGALAQSIYTVEHRSGDIAFEKTPSQK